MPTETENENVPTKERFDQLIAAKAKLERHVARLSKEVEQVNGLYERALEAQASLKADYEEQLTSTRQEYEVAGALREAGIQDAEAVEYLTHRYSTLEPSAPEGAEDGAEAVKPAFGDWLGKYKEEKPHMFAAWTGGSTPAPAKAPSRPRPPLSEPRRATNTTTANPATDYTQFLAADPKTQRDILVQQGYLPPLKGGE